MIRMIVFDLGGVFVRVNSEETVRRLKSRCIGLTENEIADVLFRSETAIAYELGKMDSTGFIEAVRLRMPIRISDEEFGNAWSDIFTLNQSMADLLPKLARQWRLGMISNTNAMHIERIRADYDLLRFFDPVIFSHEVGLMKPNEAIFRLLLEKTGLSAEECAFVDDTPGHVEAAMKMGLKGFVFRDKDTLLETFRLNGMI